jgi:Inorganic Pyrophosphatase/Protein of unknown function (DUF5661)
VAALTPKQIQELQRIVADATTAAAVITSGLEISDSERQRLVREGYLREGETDALIRDAFAYGQVQAQQARAADMPYAEFRQQMERSPLPLSDAEQHAVATAQQRAGTYVTALGDRFRAEVGHAAVEADMVYAQRVRAAIADETAAVLLARETAAELATRLGRVSQDWARDWDRIAITETQMAHQEGMATAVAERYGDDALMAKVPEPGACVHCKRLYLGEDGLPIVRPVTWWFEQGTSNVGRKSAEWKPVLGAMHPWCRCRLVRVPAGFVFDDSGELVPEEMAKADQIPGGKGDNRPDSDFNKRQLVMGTQHEMEHTNDLKLAREIAKDHLSEDPHYYTELQTIEKGRQLAGRIEFQGFPISIENDVGSVRRWKNPHDGSAGQTVMKLPYGYIRGTEGADGDHVDVFVGPKADATHAYVIRTKKAPAFDVDDEDKVMLGMPSAAAAKAAFLEHYNDPRFYGQMTVLALDAFRERLKSRRGQLIKAMRDPNLWKAALTDVGLTVEQFAKVVEAAPRHALSRKLLEQVQDHVRKSALTSEYADLTRDPATIGTMGHQGAPARTAGDSVRPPQAAVQDWPPRDRKGKRRKPRTAAKRTAIQVDETRDTLVPVSQRFDMGTAASGIGKRGALDSVDALQQRSGDRGAARAKESVVQQSQDRRALRGTPTVSNVKASSR